MPRDELSIEVDPSVLMENLSDEERQDRWNSMIRNSINMITDAGTTQFVVVALNKNKIRVSLLGDYLFLAGASVRLAALSNSQMAGGPLEYDLPPEERNEQ